MFPPAAPPRRSFSPVYSPVCQNPRPTRPAVIQTPEGRGRLRCLTLLQNAAPRQPADIAAETEPPRHGASRDAVTLPPCDVCERGLGLIRWFCSESLQRGLV